MRREVPLVITFIIGITLLSSYFFAGNVPVINKSLASIANDITSFGVVISAFAVGLASVNLIRIHNKHISRRRSAWHNSVALIGTMALFSILGIFNKHNPSNQTTFQLFRDLFDYVLSPLGAAMFAILAFYVASASYRAFRARSFEASILLIAAVVIMLARAPVGELMWRQFPAIGQWLLDIPNTAGQRAITIGAAIGGFATSMRILLGIERSHLGGGE